MKNSVDNQKILLDSLNSLAAQMVKSSPKRFSRPVKQREEIKKAVKRNLSLLYWQVLDRMTDKQFAEFKNLLDKEQDQEKISLWLEKEMGKEIRKIWQGILVEERREK